jgi:hypothetical protein
LSASVKTWTVLAAKSARRLSPSPILQIIADLVLRNIPAHWWIPPLSHPSQSIVFQSKKADASTQQDWQAVWHWKPLTAVASPCTDIFAFLGRCCPIWNILLFPYLYTVFKTTFLSCTTHAEPPSGWCDLHHRLSRSSLSIYLSYY